MTARKRSYLAWYLASPFFAVGFIRLAMVLPRFMDTKRGFEPVYHHANVAPNEHFESPLAARDAASAALRDLAHEATAAGATSVAIRAYDVESAIARGDPRATRDAMDRLEKEAAGAERAASFAAQIDFARIRVRAWLDLVVTD